MCLTHFAPAVLAIFAEGFFAGGRFGAAGAAAFGFAPFLLAEDDNGFGAIANAPTADSAL